MVIDEGKISKVINNLEKLVDAIFSLTDENHTYKPDYEVGFILKRLNKSNNGIKYTSWKRYNYFSIHFYISNRKDDIRKLADIIYKTLNFKMPKVPGVYDFISEAVENGELQIYVEGNPAFCESMDDVLSKLSFIDELSDDDFELWVEMQ